MLTILMESYTFTKENENWYSNLEDSISEFYQRYLVLIKGFVWWLDFLSNKKKKVALSLATIPFEKTFKPNVVKMG